MVLIEKEHLKRVRDLMKERRIALLYKQVDAARRSGVNIATLRKFEQSGAISFYNLLKLMVLYKMDSKVMDCIEDRRWWTIEELQRAEKQRTVR